LALWRRYPKTGFLVTTEQNEIIGGISFIPLKKGVFQELIQGKRVKGTSEFRVSIVREKTLSAPPGILQVYFL